MTYSRPDTRTRSHQVLIGLALLTLAACGCGRKDHAMPTIVVPGDVNHGEFHALVHARGRDLTREELLDLHRVWIDNEVLYREGLTQSPQPETGANREQVIARALNAIELKLRPIAVSDDELRRWFESRRERYDQSALYDFEDVALPGKSSEASVRTLVQQLNSGAPPNAQANVRGFKARPETAMAQSYGVDLASALAKAQPGTWLAISARDGWRAVRLTALTPGRNTNFDAEREAIRRDFIESTLADKRTDAVHALWKHYKIEIAEPIECLADKTE
jgi:hypothetical protein